MLCYVMLIHSKTKVPVGLARLPDFSQILGTIQCWPDLSCTTESTEPTNRLNFLLQKMSGNIERPNDYKETAASNRTKAMWAMRRTNDVLSATLGSEGQSLDAESRRLLQMYIALV